MAFVAASILLALALYVGYACSNLLRFRRSSQVVLSVVEISLKERRNLVNQFLQNADHFELGPELKENLQEAYRQAETAKEIHEMMSKEHLLSVVMDRTFSSLSSESNARLSGFKKGLKNLEDEIAETGRQYNQLARMFNSHVEHFPTNIIARMMGLKEVSFFNLK